MAHKRRIILQALQDAAEWQRVEKALARDEAEWLRWKAAQHVDDQDRCRALSRHSAEWQRDDKYVRCILESGHESEHRLLRDEDGWMQPFPPDAHLLDGTLRELIESADHGRTCQSYETDEDWKMLPCNCWKQQLDDLLR